MPLKSRSYHSYNFEANGNKVVETTSSESITSGFIKSLKIDDLKFNRNKYELKQETLEKGEPQEKFRYVSHERSQSHKILNSSETRVHPNLIQIQYPSSSVNDCSIQEKTHHKNLLARTNDDLIKIPMLASTLLSNLSDRTVNKSSHNQLRSPSKTSDDNYIQLKQYRLKFDIGKGSYGIVKLAYNQEDDKNYAMKMVSKKKLMKRSNLLNKPRKISDPSKQVSDSIQREIAILKKLDHPNIVKLIEVLNDPTEDFLCLVFELVEKGPVISIPTNNPLSEENSWKYFRDLVLGVEYLHFQQIIHRDLKPSNLLLSNDDHIKIADFGISYEFDGEDAIITNTSGTPCFLAPETLATENHSWRGKPLDVWAMGITLFSFVYGQCPFQDDCAISLRNKIRYNNVIFPQDKNISYGLKDLILKILQKDPNKRMSIDSIKKHSWVTKNDTANFENENQRPETIDVTEEEIQNCVKTMSKLDTLILIKSMIRKKSFTYPFKLSKETSLENND